MRMPVFFSGGTAIGQLARFFARHDIPCAYLITTFDNGGSSAELRQAFAMPAPGDLRNRLLMLTPRDLSPGIRPLLRLRFSKSLPADALERQFQLLLNADNMNWRKMPAAVKNSLREALLEFARARPGNFSLANASVGNLVLAGFYLLLERNISAAVAKLSELLRICGAIEPITQARLQIGCLLADGQTVVGQEKFKSLPAPIRDIFFAGQGDGKATLSAPPAITERAAQLLARASIICYPPGSFFSSVLVNLMCAGAPEAIAANPCPKIFIPNSGPDPETKGMGVLAQARLILKTLTGWEDAPPKGLLDYVLVDSENGWYGPDLAGDLRSLETMGVKILDRKVVCENRPERHLPKNVAESVLEISEIHA